MLLIMNFTNQKNIVFTSILLILFGWVSPAIAHEVNKSAVVLLVAKDKAGKTVGTGSGLCNSTRRYYHNKLPCTR